MQMSTEIMSCSLETDKSKLSYPSFVTFWNELINVVVIFMSFELNDAFHDFTKEFPRICSCASYYSEFPCQINVFDYHKQPDHLQRLVYYVLLGDMP